MSQSPNNQLGNVLGGAAFSPDGSRIAFVASDTKSPVGVVQGGAPNELLDLWVFDRRSKTVKRLTHDRQGYDILRWSPDGEFLSAHGLIGFVTSELPPTLAGRSRDDLYVWHLKTGRKWLIAKDIYSDNWRADSRGILFVTFGGETEASSLGVWTTKTHKVQVVATGVGEEAIWTPDGKGILFDRSNGARLYYMPVPVGKEKLIMPLSGRVFFHDWSPDKKWMLYSLPDLGQLALLKWPSVASRRLLSNAQYFSYQWSPRNSSIAVAYHGTSPGNDAFATRLSTFEATSGKDRLLKEFSDEAQALGWTDDDTIIILHSPLLRRQVSGRWQVTSERQEIVAVSAQTGASRILAKLPSPPTTMYADWRIVSSKGAAR